MRTYQVTAQTKPAPDVTARPAGVPADVLTRLQQSAGNAAVVSLLAASANPAVHRRALPADLRARLEAVGKVPMGDVEVHEGAVPVPGAYAASVGTDIYLPRSERSTLEHEAWHVVQQKQHRVPVPAGGAGTSGLRVNDDPALEAEADTWSTRGSSPPPAAAQSGEAPGTSPAVAQLIKVGPADVGQDFSIVDLWGTAHPTATLSAISTGGWYHFTLPDGSPVTVRGQSNITARVVLPPPLALPLGAPVLPLAPPPLAPPLGAPLPVAPPPLVPVPLFPPAPSYDVDALATAHGVAPAQVFTQIRDHFHTNPGTARVHTPFGAKTISKGYQAFEDPAETQKAPQAMVNHRQGDYGYPGARIGTEYQDWATEMAGGDNPEQAALAMWEWVEDGTAPDLALFGPRQQASAAAILVTSQVSEPLRTNHLSQDASDRGRAALVPVALGDGTWEDIFSGDDARYYPARPGGSARERADMRGGPRTPGAMDIDDYMQ